ncbi:biotin/lipoyl-containing protein [Geodermatophilus sp. TF02-6]|uniref:acetyl-CoA carboxylase biotin carboxyl carrier protein n=1 Tax=Geodermatophilus sp. TF02-6 TaxID=2250575 RepID=UPI0018F651CE|nr:biotin/lipoyl-containing protein [Geodermatophilus sp. TF02-6]
MDLTPDDVRDVLHALDSSGLDELHLELADLTLTVRREGASGWTAEQQVLRRPVVEGHSGHEGPTDSGRSGHEGPSAAVAEGMVAVHPPLLGTFYRAPKPGAAPFVEVGDLVTEDTVVGIVETMKMMTPVHAGVRGTVVEVRAGNGEFADTDAVLLVVDPASGTAGLGEGAS